MVDFDCSKIDDVSQKVRTIITQKMYDALQIEEFRGTDRSTYNWMKDNFNRCTNPNKYYREVLLKLQHENCGGLGLSRDEIRTLRGLTHQAIERLPKYGIKKDVLDEFVKHRDRCFFPEQFYKPQLDLVLGEDCHERIGKMSKEEQIQLEKDLKDAISRFIELNYDKFDINIYDNEMKRCNVSGDYD